MADKTGWGILGAGSIARKMASALKTLPEAELVAVGSRTRDKARAFAEETGAAKAYGSYQAMIQDPEVDIVYVATPHPMHAENMLMAIEHGKAVLSEKPFTVNHYEAERVVAAAREKSVFVMEGMWTRFLPIMRRLKELVQEGRIGQVRMVQADFGFRAGVDPKSRLFDLKLGGGALLDVGVYCVSLAYWVLGEPKEAVAVAHLGETGADEQNGILLGYEGGQIALLSSAIRTNTPHTATIIGTDGHIRIPNFWHASTMVVTSDGTEETIELPFGDNGFEFEAEECIRCLREGRLESPVMPLDETVSIMKTMDSIREPWGLVYPADRW